MYYLVGFTLDSQGQQTSMPPPSENDPNIYTLYTYMTINKYEYVYIDIQT